MIPEENVSNSSKTKQLELASCCDRD